MLGHAPGLFSAVHLAANCIAFFETGPCHFPEGSYYSHYYYYYYDHVGLVKSDQHVYQQQSDYFNAEIQNNRTGCTLMLNARTMGHETASCIHLYSRSFFDQVSH